MELKDKYEAVAEVLFAIWGSIMLIGRVLSFVLLLYLVYFYYLQHANFWFLGFTLAFGLISRTIRGGFLIFSASDVAQKLGWGSWYHIGLYVWAVCTVITYSGVFFLEKDNLR